MAGRIRSIKPEWLEDELMIMASSDARVLSIALILLADDYGNGRCHELSVAPKVFPPSSGESLEELTKVSRRFHEALTELVKNRFVGLYDVRGQHYFTIRKWKEHQKVQHPGKPIVPGPPEGFWNSSRESHESLTPDLKGHDQRDLNSLSGDLRNSSSLSDLPKDMTGIPREKPRKISVSRTSELPEVEEIKRRCREEPTSDISERAAICLRDRFGGTFEDPKGWPELQAMAFAFSATYGARHRRLGHLGHDKGLDALLGVLAAGIGHRDYMRAVELSAGDDWFSKLKSPDLRTLNIDQVRRLLAEADEAGER